MKWLRGDRDEPHLAMACWNFLCLLDTQARIEEGLLPAELNDLPYNPLSVLDNPLSILSTFQDKKPKKAKRAIRKIIKKAVKGTGKATRKTARAKR